MPKDTSQLFTHSQQYIREVFEAYLRKNGFVSYRDQGFSWYRVVNNEVIQTIYFHTRHAWIPVIMEVGYGSHPLYISPVYPSGVFYRDPPVNLEIFSVDRLLKFSPGSSNIDYASDALVMCPNDAYHGLDIIENIVENMNQQHSAQDIYQMHKGRYEGRGYRAASTDFFDEVIYYNDIALYEPCLEMVNEFIVGWGRAPKPSAKIIRMLNQLQLQKHVMKTGNREEILALLAKRQDKNVKDLQRKVGIVVSPVNFEPYM